MKAGQTNIEVGTLVEIINVKGEDKHLNGLKGTVTHPFAFGCTERDWVGVWLDAGQSNMPYGANCNVTVKEIKVLTDNN
jgi:hypothetical protein